MNKWIHLAVGMGLMGLATATLWKSLPQEALTHQNWARCEEQGSKEPFPVTGPMKLNDSEALIAKAAMEIVPDTGAGWVLMQNKSPWGYQIELWGENEAVVGRWFIRAQEQLKIVLPGGAYSGRWIAGTAWEQNKISGCKKQGRLAGLIAIKDTKSSWLVASRDGLEVKANRLDDTSLMEVDSASAMDKKSGGQSEKNPGQDRQPALGGRERSGRDRPLR